MRVLHSILASFIATAGIAQDAPMPILFTNVNVWDGKSDGLLENANVVVTGNLITAVSTEPGFRDVLLGREFRESCDPQVYDFDRRRGGSADRPVEPIP